MKASRTMTIGVLALQGAFAEHLTLLHKAAAVIAGSSRDSGTGTPPAFEFVEVRTPEQLDRCDALVIPGGESTTLAFVAKQTNLMEPLKRFVKIDSKPTWGTCAGLILLADEATGAKKGGQELVGGLHVRAHRNHFGRQVHSFQAGLDLPFLADLHDGGGGSGGKVAVASGPFPGVFIRAPVVEKILPSGDAAVPHVEVLGSVSRGGAAGDEDIIAVRQGNIFATSFHPELTDDVRVHLWWLQQAVKAWNDS
ncbi:glutamine amidotransferase subunit pdxT [Magnaporthiopsis poae ATCC 64411]|uniref:glutaminase n=1 Tax=Magnaporthiopsis poae (strain ATCC 64411 / 73-15) TaxID=644358 RepID=A0A0C4DSR4_MAGP6|nr:glutamine amidotransferase subunit pdxT [Magnaporthiopsis poae ATCC 64411]